MSGGAKCGRCNRRPAVFACGDVCQVCAADLMNRGYAWDEATRSWAPTGSLFEGTADEGRVPVPVPAVRARQQGLGF